MQQVPRKKEKNTEKRRHIWLISGAVLVLVCIAVLLLLPRLRKQEVNTSPVLQQNPVIRLYQPDGLQLSEVEITPKNGQSYRLKMQDGELKLCMGEKLLSIDESDRENLLSIFTSLTAQDTVAQTAAEVASSLADMGLEPPQCTAVATYSDGSRIQLELGGDIPETGYTYFRWSGGDGIYAADEGMRDILNRSAERLLPIEQPDFNYMLVEKIKLTNAQGACEITIEQDEEGHSIAKVTEPTLYPASNESVAGLLRAINNFYLGSVTYENLTESESAYGFENPVCTLEVTQSAGYSTNTDAEGSMVIEPVEAKSFRFVFGRPEGEHFYTCEYEGKSFLVSGVMIQSFLNMGAKDFVSRQPMNLEDVNLAKLSLDEANSHTEWKFVYTETSDSTEEITYTLNSATRNGEEVPLGLGQSLLDELKAFTVSGDVSQDEAPAGEALWQLKLTGSNGRTRILQGYGRDSFTQLLSVDGTVLHFIHTESIERLFDLIRNGSIVPITRKPFLFPCKYAIMHLKEMML